MNCKQCEEYQMLLVSQITMMKDSREYFNACFDSLQCALESKTMIVEMLRSMFSMALFEKDVEMRLRFEINPHFDEDTLEHDSI